MSTERRAAAGWWLAAVLALWAIKACAGITDPCVDMLTYEVRSCEEPATKDG